ncbi:hypothetical protein [Parachlamydia sp. AcF125]|uniref:hypothetical protein n=1 Tax=Parachlamydia sp. AcF125 TaxID=2795736 RepID=UPI001BC9C88E|nr:hypothetical protein [Parachlamydia sp. AcF125]MBS4168619.1 hypothetical protein [Parachlamydia sp. AcF125]
MFHPVLPPTLTSTEGVIPLPPLDELKLSSLEEASSDLQTEILPFIPAEDPLDKRVAFFIQLGYMDIQGILTKKFYETFKGPPPLQEQQLDEIRKNLFLQRKFHKGHFCMGNMLEALCAKAEVQYAHTAKAYYVGSEVKRYLKEYFALFLSMISHGELTELDEGSLQELSHQKHDGDYFILLRNPRVASSAKFMVDETINFLANVAQSDYSTIRQLGLKNRKILPNFSLISWENSLEISDLVFSSKRDRSFPEKELSIEVSHFLEAASVYPLGIPLEEEDGHENASQGITDFLTRIVHGNVVHLNEQAWVMLIALLSQERRIYALEEGKTESLLEELTLKRVVGQADEAALEKIKVKIINHLIEHHFRNKKMAFAMACNACLCLRKFFPSEQIDRLFFSLIDKVTEETPYSVFALIKEGIFRQKLSFLELMQIHACFAILSFGVKNPRFQEKALRIFLTKHEGNPAVKILEGGNSIFLPFDPLSGYRICLELLAKEPRAQVYLNKLLIAYLPLDAFSIKEGSQLSSYPQQLIPLLDPLQSEIRERGFNQEAFTSKLSYMLLGASQTCQPRLAYINLMLENFPFLFDTFDRADLLLKQMEGLLNLVTPWKEVSVKIISAFESLKKEGRKTILAWIEAILSSKTIYAAERVEKIWKNTPALQNNENITLRLVYKLTHIKVLVALRMFKSYKDFPILNRAKRSHLFIHLGSKLLQETCEAKDLISYMEAGRSLYTHIEFEEFKNQSVPIFIEIVARLIALKHLAVAREFLLVLAEKNILEPVYQDVSSLWRDCLQHILSEEKFQPLGLSVWNGGKKYKVWHDKEAHIKNALSLAEQLAKKDVPPQEEFSKILNYICASRLKDDRIYPLVLKYIQQQGGITAVRKVPAAYLTYLSRNEKLQILLNALTCEIANKNIDESLVLVHQILPHKPGGDRQEVFQKLIHALIQEIISMHSARHLEGVQKIFSPEFYTGEQDKNFKTNCLLKLVKNFSYKLNLEQFSLPLQNLFILIIEQTLDSPLSSDFGEFCLDLLQKFQKLPHRLKEYLEKNLIRLLQYAYSKAGSQPFFALVQLLSYNACLNAAQEELELFSLEVLNDSKASSQAFLGVHDLCKGYFKKKRISSRISVELIEKFIFCFLPVSKPFAFYWTLKLISCSSNLSPSHFELCLQVSGTLEPFQENELLEKLYDYQPEWVSFAKKLIARNRYAPLYPLILKHGKNVILKLKDQTRDLLNHFPAQLGFPPFLSLIEHGKIETLQDWHFLIEKIQQFNSKQAHEYFYNLFVKKVLHNTQFPASSSQKSECLIALIPLFSVEYWIANQAVFIFFESPLVRDEKIYFYTQISKNVLGLLVKSEIEEASQHIQTWQKFYKKLKKEEREAFREADNGVIAFLLNHENLNLVSLGCRVLKSRFIEGEEQTAEKFLLVLVKRVHFSEEDLAPLIVELLSDYLKILKPQLLNKMMESMASLQHPQMREVLSHLILKFITHEQPREIPPGFFQLLTHQMTFYTLAKTNFEILAEKKLERFLTKGEIDLLYAKWLETKLLKGDTPYEKIKAIHLFFDNFERFSELPTERLNGLQNISQIIFSKDISQQTPILFQAFFILYLTGKTMSGEARRKVFAHAHPVLALLMENKLDTILGEGAPSLQEPLVIERCFNYLQIMLGYNFSVKSSHPEFASIVKASLKELIKLLSFLTPEKREELKNFFINTIQEFVYLAQFKQNKKKYFEGLDEILGDAARTRLYENRADLYGELFFCAFEKWPKALEILPFQQSEILSRILKRIIGNTGLSSFHDGFAFFVKHAQTFVKSQDIYLDSLKCLLNLANENSFMKVINFYSVKLDLIKCTVIDQAEIQPFLLSITQEIFFYMEKRLSCKSFIQIGLFYLSELSMRNYFDDCMHLFYFYLKKIGTVMLERMREAPEHYVDKFLECLFQNYYFTNQLFSNPLRIKIIECDFYLKKFAEILPSSHKELKQKILSREIESLISEKIEDQFLLEASLLNDYIGLFVSCPEKIRKRGLYILKVIQRYFFKHPHLNIRKIGKKFILSSYKNLASLLEKIPFETYEESKIYVYFLTNLLELQKRSAPTEKEEGFILYLEIVKNLFKGARYQLHDHSTWVNFYFSMITFLDMFCELGMPDLFDPYYEILDQILISLLENAKFIKFKDKKDNELMELLLTKIFIHQKKKNEITEHCKQKVRELCKKWLRIYEKSNKIQVGRRYLNKYHDQPF